VEPSFKTIVSNGKFKVCDTDSSYANPPEKGTLANARLIAAAPELLAGAKLAVEEFDQDGQVFRDAIGSMRRAIAKAEGRQT
jgi:hypothetical protein